MDGYYRQIGPWGAVMMRHTASLQLNLDLGPEGVWQERWLAANLLSPLVTATFTTSPGPGIASQRALAWQRLDTTRTGFPPLLSGGSGSEPEREWAEAALAANVMMLRRATGTIIPCEPGFTFARWISDGHPEVGHPTSEDLDLHLTTLFFEVRPRGFLEMRAGDALPDWLRTSAVALVTAAVYDERARAEALSALAPLRPRLDVMWHRAAREGIHDPELGSLARKVWPLALAGIGRLPAGFVGREVESEVSAFLERYTFSNRTPGDELEELDRQDPARALEWASDGWSRAAGLRSVG
jgi:glutamate--cysteine ligase